MVKRIKVASKKDIPAGEGRVVQADGKEIALFNVDGSFYALDNACPHRAGPLGDGPLEGSFVTCPWHGWQFDVKTGGLAMNPDSKVPCYKVDVKGEDVYVEIG